MIIIMLCYFEIFTSYQGSMRTFSKHYSKCKTDSIMFGKTLQERRPPIFKFSQDNPQNNYLNFLTHKNIFIILQYYVECSPNIVETLFCDYWNLPGDHICYYQIIHLTQKQFFHRELFKRSFPLKCSLNVPWMSRTLQPWKNFSEFSRNIACRLGCNCVSGLYLHYVDRPFTY